MIDVKPWSVYVMFLVASEASEEYRRQTDGRGSVAT